MTKPLKIENLTLHNRLVMPPMATSKAEPDGSVSQAVIDYYDEKSKGDLVGVGRTILKDSEWAKRTIEELS